VILPLWFAPLRASSAPPHRGRCGQAVRVLTSGGPVLGDPMQSGGGPDRAVTPPLAAVRPLQVARHRGHRLQHAGQRGRSDALRPAGQGTLRGARLTVEPTALAQPQAVSDKGGGGRDTPALPRLDHQQAPDALHGCRGAPVVRQVRSGPTPGASAQRDGARRTPRAGGVRAYHGQEDQTGRMCHVSRSL